MTAADAHPQARGSRVAVFFALAFVGLGLPRLFTNTAALTLFLETYDADLLPLTYVGAGIVIPLVGAFYARLERLVSFRGLLVGALAVNALTLVMLRFALDGSAGGLAVVAAAIWVEVEWTVLSLVFWGLAERCFDLGQAKRNFGLIAAGEAVAALVGGLAMQLVLGVLAVADLLWISVLSEGIAIALILRITATEAGHLARQHHEVAPEAHAARGAETPVRRYLRLLFALVVVANAVHFTVSNAFFGLVELNLDDSQAVAGFLGLFFAATAVATLVGNLLVTERVLRRRGVRVGLMLLPVLTGLGALTVVGAQWLLAPMALIFAFGCLTKLLNESCYQGVFWPSLMLLYQPLIPRQRTRAQALVEGVFEPLAAAATGALLLLAVPALGLGPQDLLTAVVPLVLAWIALVLATHRRYVTMLGRAVSARRISGRGLSLDDPDTLAVLRRALASTYPAERIHGARLLLEARATSASREVLALLSDPESLVRRAVAREIERLPSAAFAIPLVEHLDAEPDPAVQSALLRALLACDRGHGLERARRALDADDRALRGAAVVALLRHGGISGVATGADALLELASSRRPANRMLAARVLAEVGVAEYQDPLASLLADPVRAVRREALHAATRLRARVSRRRWCACSAATTSRRWRGTP